MHNIVTRKQGHGKVSIIINVWQHRGCYCFTAYLWSRDQEQTFNPRCPSAQRKQCVLIKLLTQSPWLILCLYRSVGGCGFCVMLDRFGNINVFFMYLPCLIENVLFLLQWLHPNHKIILAFIFSRFP